MTAPLPAPPTSPPSIAPGRIRVGPSPIHGLGVFATVPLEADEVVGRLEGMPTGEDGTYVLWFSDDLGLEITNDLRFINHSVDPNCVFTEFELVALRPIEAGEELTHHYGTPAFD